MTPQDPLYFGKQSILMNLPGADVDLIVDAVISPIRKLESSVGGPH